MARMRRQSWPRLAATPPPVGMMDIRLPGNARVRVRPPIGTAGLREVILEAKTVLRCSWRRAVESTERTSRSHAQGLRKAGGGAGQHPEGRPLLVQPVHLRDKRGGYLEVL